MNPIAGGALVSCLFKSAQASLYFSGLAIPMVSFRELVGTHDIVFITLDTLRYDVAQQAFEQGRTPEFARFLPASGWEHRHSPASFTYAAHHAFFAGFLPTPARPGKHPRLFSAEFLGSETTGEGTYCFPESDLISALRRQGYYTICIGGVGFFNKQTQLGQVLPGFFDESHWSPQLSVTDPQSTENQVAVAIEVIKRQPGRIMLFLNVSAIHQPNYFYVSPRRYSERELKQDSLASHMEALCYVDRSLRVLWHYLEQRAAGFCILCSDHGTAYGEDGYSGHRIGHASVWDVPFATFCYGELPVETQPQEAIES